MYAHTLFLIVYTGISGRCEERNKRKKEKGGGGGYGKVKRNIVVTHGQRASSSSLVVTKPSSSLLVILPSGPAQRARCSWPQSSARQLASTKSQQKKQKKNQFSTNVTNFSTSVCICFLYMFSAWGRPKCQTENKVGLDENTKCISTLEVYWTRQNIK